MNVKKKNLLELSLELLKVKFTKKYTQRLYEQTPHRNTLFGMSSMLSDYNVNHIPFKVKDMDEIESLQLPLIVDLMGNVTLIDKLTNGEVSFLYGDGKTDTLSLNDFKEKWNGIVLMPEITKDSGEPNYKEHKVKEIFSKICLNILIATFLIVFSLVFYTNNIYDNSGLVFLSVINLIGVYIGCLLVQKQMYIPSNQADKICSLLKKANCNSVLDSPAAKLMGAIGWSEIGLSYFISNIFITVFFPHLISYLVLINICGLPYTIWSVWYQKYKVKEWCPLCLIIQALLWIICISNLLFGYLSFFQFITFDILSVGCIYLMPLVAINILLPILNSKTYIRSLEKEIYRLKLNPGVFKALLKQQPYYQTDFSTSQITWGNRNSNLLVTIVTNPHCKPCEIMHKRITKLLQKTDNNICIQYIFSSFSEYLELSNEFLTAVYLSSEIIDEKKKEIYHKWFEEGKYVREEFFTQFNLDADKEKVKEELNKHKEWQGMKEVYGTPTIFVNGFELPHQYQIEDLIYFMDLKI